MLVAAIGAGIAFAYLLTQLDVSFVNITGLRNTFSLPVIGTASNIAAGRGRGLHIVELTGYTAMCGIMFAAFFGVLTYGDEISLRLRELRLDELL